MKPSPLENIMSASLPVLFVSHGAPTFALEPGVAGPRLAEVGRRLPVPRAILVVSPHWMTRGGVGVTAAAQPETIHDFGGFPAALYALQYPVAGHPALAERTASLLREAGYPVALDAGRGLDHGAWVPLRYLFPNADVPVFQVSLPYPLTAAQAVALGKALRPLRDEGVLIVGSGSLTHNLSEFRGPGHEDQPYVKAFVAWVREAVLAGDTARIADFRSLAPHAARAHPSDDHFLPLLVALGATEAGDEPVEVIDGGITYGMLSMESYLIGSMHV